MPYPNRKHLMQLLTCLLVLCFCNTSFAAEVSLWSLESLSSDKKGNFAEIWVSCAGDDTKIYLRKRSGSRRWCASDDTSLCSRDKREAARLVCADDSPIQLAKRAKPKEPELVRQEDNPTAAQASPVSSSPPQKPAVEAVKTGYEGMATIDLTRERNVLQQEQAELESKLRQLNSRKLELKKQLGGI